MLHALRTFPPIVAAVGLAACQVDAPVDFDAGSEAGDATFSSKGLAQIPGGCTPGSQEECSWMGYCNAEGTTCVCYEADHRLGDERCANWYSELPSDPEPLVIAESVPPGDPDCPEGGSKFTAEDGTVTFACNGAPGVQGPAGPPGPAGNFPQAVFGPRSPDQQYPNILDSEMTVVDSVLLPPGIWWVNFTIKFNVQAQLSQSGSQAQPSVYCLYDNRVLTARSSGFTVVDTGGGLGTLPSLYYGDLHMTAQAVFELEEETRVKIECQSVGTDDDHGDVTYASSAVMALPLPGGVQYQWGSGENRQVPIYVDP